MTIEIGTKLAHENDGTWNLDLPTGSRTAIYLISFQKQHTTPPKVMAAITSITSKEFSDLTFEIKALSPTIAGFTLQVSAVGSTDGRSTYKSAEISWIAVSE